ncbi:MAG: hypothetical protein HPY66_1833 [Firmicutes bacterium]|nr:hypothetical protein [Bacillota bacterium]
MKLLDKLEEFICSIGLLSATIILFINIFLRYIFSKGFPWAEESVRYLILVVTFIGLGIGIRDKQIIRMDFLLQLMKDNFRRKAEVVVNLVAFVFSIWLAGISFQFAMQTKSYGQISSALQLPFYVLYLVICTGSFLSAIRYFQELIFHIKGSEANSIGEAKK